MQSLEIFRQYDVVLCDIDGVLHTGHVGIAGAPALLDTLRATGPPFVFLTNNGTVVPERIAAWLESIGLGIAVHDLVTAGEALVDDFREHGLVGQAVINVGSAGAAEYIRRAGGRPLAAAEARGRFREARAVVVGSTRGLDKDVLDAACNAIHLNGVPVVCTNPDVFVPEKDGEITLVSGALANLFERELGVGVRRLGKPYRPIFDLAMRRVRERLRLEAPRVLVVDDNLESGIGGGAALGFDTLLVLSGWHRSRAGAEAAMDRLGIRPTYVLESVAH